MLLTMHLTVTETAHYAHPDVRAKLRNTARTLAHKSGRRFAQVVGSDGRILDVLEIHA